jgi:hypothetical protein
MTKAKDYIVAQNAFTTLTDVKIGSLVKIINIAESEELGWGCVWSPKMNRFVNDGKEYRVNRVHERYGIRFRDENGDDWNFPFFCVKVTGREAVEIPLDSGEYTVIVNGDGSIQVGCQNISRATLAKIFDASTKEITG